MGERLYLTAPCTGCGASFDGCNRCTAGTEYRVPTPADLLTDPRVRALVEAGRKVIPWCHDGSTHELEAALAPFEVSRG